MLTIFAWNFEIWAVQEYVNLVDRVKNFPTSIYLQKSASIQPRTGLSKFGGKFNSLFIRLLTDGCKTLIDQLIGSQMRPLWPCRLRGAFFEATALPKCDQAFLSFSNFLDFAWTVRGFHEYRLAGTGARAAGAKQPGPLFVSKAGDRDLSLRGRVIR